VEKRRPITEDDIYLTELLIAKSYGNLKRSVARTSSETLASMGTAVGGTVKKHPYATAGTAVGVGILLFLFMKLMSGGGSSRKKHDSERDEKRRSSMSSDLLGMLMPLMIPYVTGYIESCLGRAFSRKDRD
jgi:hypothetical protein